MTAIRQNINQSIYRKPTYASFFHGVGGMSIGAQKAGFVPVYATDMWDAAEYTYGLNNAQGIFHNADFTTLEFSDVQAELQRQGQSVIMPGDIDCIASGSPCPGMSSANSSRYWYDARNYLMLKQVRFACSEGFRTKTAWFEQVPGLFEEPIKPFLRELKATLNAQKEYLYLIEVLNAVDYGAHQSRNRVTVIMVHRDLGVLPSLPAPVPVDIEKVCAAALFPGVDAIRSVKRGTDPVTGMRKRSSEKSAFTNVVGTLTATGGGLELHDGNGWRPVTVEEQKVVSHLTDYNFGELSDRDITRLIGNMVQIPFAEAIMNHIRSEILERSGCLEDGAVSI